MTADTELYERDFIEWAHHNARLLRSGCLEKADIDHIAEEIEDLGKSQHRALESRLEALIEHLLKWKFQPERRSRSWRNTIREQRAQIARLLGKMPSLGPQLPANLEEIYELAVAVALLDTRLPETAFPPSSPFSLDQILDQDFFPE
jgi:Domain of unknown function DUF29